MSWQCPSCGLTNNDDGSIRCLCGHEKDPVDQSAVTTDSSSSSPLIDQVKAALENNSSPKKSLPQKIVILLISIFIFANLGLLENSITGVLVLVGVILFHEAGHLLGMKLFGYRDLQVFFIPLFGAASSGIETNPSSARKAVVALLGPVPGIIVGIIAAVVFFKTKEDFYALCASTLLFINGFNLLPFHPLDGGRFFEYLIFSKKPLYEVGFKLITGLALLANSGDSIHNYFAELSKLSPELIELSKLSPELIPMANIFTGSIIHIKDQSEDGTRKARDLLISP